MLNKAVWVYLEHPELWESLGTFASIDRVRKDRWFLADVEPYLIEAPFPDSETPDLEMLKGELAPYIQGHQGRGKYLDIVNYRQKLSALGIDHGFEGFLPRLASV